MVITITMRTLWRGGVPVQVTRARMFYVFFVNAAKQGGHFE